MRHLVILAYITTVVNAQQQNSRRPESHDNGHGWDIRLAVPGEPGGDYPTLNNIPRTSFSCSRKTPGYYADVETGCQVFRVCTIGSTYGFQSFLCPNGTLFNQEVFVCDWWMNVNCDRSQILFNENKDKFGNLKLGPQLMKDIKKMLTHPMRYPYDKSIMKSNLIVMQEYKPPSGQLFPNGALIFGPERPPNNVYIPAKQRQGNFVQNSFISGDLSFAASTPSSQYIPSSFNTERTSKNIGILQQQRQSIQNSNSHAGQPRIKNSEFFNNNRIPHSSYAQNHNQRNFQSTLQNLPNGQTQRQLPNQSSNINSLNHGIQSDHNVNNPPKKLSYTSKQNAQIIQKNNNPPLSVGRETHENFGGSNSVQPIGKTLKFSRIVQKSTSGNPKSRITFKTWIVRPSKTGRLVVEPTPYSYDKPPNPPTRNELVETTVYEQNPTTEKFNPESENVPYVYNRPTPSSKQIVAIEDTPVIYLPPTVPTLSNRLYSTTKLPQTPKESYINLPPTTYKPASRFYVPPSGSSLELSRQYLNPNEQLSENMNYQSSRLIVTPTSPSLEFTTIISKTKETPTFSLTKQSHINTNRNNLTFADILTKEKLDITVNDIVKNTNEILKTSSPDELNRYREQPEHDDNIPKSYLSPEFDSGIDENIKSQPPQIRHKSEKLIATPSTELEPPIANSNSNYQNSNKLLNLPYFKDPAIPTNTIERTVSLKITIPETIAEYLFKNHTQSNSDNLEILNTGSSNYLVLTNNNVDENSGAGLIPIGKLIWDKNNNISNSQALVYSFLADSINAAKEYSNIAKQNFVSSTSTQPPPRNINNEDIDDITDKISRLTALQFAKDEPNKGKFVTPPTSNGEYKDNSKHVVNHFQRSTLNHQTNSQYLEENPPDRIFLQRLSSNNVIKSPQRDTEQIYSGQLYQLSVPEVTSKIYNSPYSIQSPQIRQTVESPRNAHRNVHENNIKNQPSTDVETFPTELPYPPIIQQLPHTGKSTIQFHNTQDTFENIFADNFFNTDTAITAEVQDKIRGSLPHPLEENKLVTYQKNKSYYLYTKLDDDSNNNIEATNTITQTNEQNNLQNAKLIQNNDVANRVTYELFPAIGYELEDEQEKQQILNSFKINDFRDSTNNDKSENFNKRRELVTGVDFTILHPTSKKQVEKHNNNINTVLYRGPSSYLAPQSSVGSLGNTQQTKGNARLEQFEENNGYSKAVPARQFSF